MTTEPIVVGVDGSDSAIQAVRWAAEEAIGRKAPLRLVHACLVINPQPALTLPSTVQDALAGLGQAWLSNALTAAKKVAPEVDVSVDLVHGDAASVLISESKSAQLTVLGSRGLGGFTELLVGSIAIAVAARGHCPVAVIRGENADRGGKPVVVGVDGSPAGEAAIAFGYEQAARLGVPLVALHTWSDTLPAMTFAMVPAAVDWSELRAAAEQVLAERLAGWQEKYPEVEVHRVVTRDRPAHSLIELAREAQLVVVGSRGRGGATGLLFGSTSQALLHHAPCPVVVVRPA